MALCQAIRASLATAFLGAHTSNLAAISAALCTGPDAHPDPAKRWMTGPFYALWWGLIALFGSSLVGLFGALPPALLAIQEAGADAARELRTTLSVLRSQEDGGCSGRQCPTRNVHGRTHQEGECRLGREHTPLPVVVRDHYTGAKVHAALGLRVLARLTGHVP